MEKVEEVIEEDLMDKEEKDDEIISEGAEYSPKSEFSKPKVVEEAVKKCVEARGKEMRDGYFNTKLDKEGNPIRTWIPDSRKEFISCVEALMCLMAPETLRDKPYKKFYEDNFDKDMEYTFDEFCYSSRELDENEKRELIWKKTNLEYIPNIDEFCVVRDMQNPRTFIKVKGAWNDKVKQYYDQLLPIYDEVFSELNKVIDRLNYFKAKLSF